MESNENTIYECANDNTKWYGSNNVPEVCPVCGSEGSISLPQGFASEADKITEINSVEPIIEAAPVEDTPVAPEVSAPSAPTEEVPVEEVAEVASVDAPAEVVEPEVSEQVVE